MLQNETFVPKDYFKDKIGVLSTKKDLKTLKDICDTCGFTYVEISDFYLEQMKIMYYDFNTCKLYLNSLPKELKDSINRHHSIDVLADEFKTFLTTNQTIINNSKNFTTMQTTKTTSALKSSKKSMFNSIIEKYKSQYFPSKVDDLRIATDGSICVPMGDEYVAIDAQNNLKAYPAEFCMSVPVFTVKKPFREVKAGDIVKHNNTYAKVLATEPKNNSIKTLTYKGAVSTKKEITDVILGQSFVEVVVNMFNNIGGNTGGLNPMMLMMMQDEDSSFDMKDMLMLQMMQGNGQGFNPMMLMIMDGQSDNSFMNLMIMQQMMSGGQGFNFNPFAPQTTTVADVVPTSAE